MEKVQETMVECCSERETTWWGRCGMHYLPVVGRSRGLFLYWVRMCLEVGNVKVGEAC